MSFSINKASNGFILVVEKGMFNKPERLVFSSKDGLIAEISKRVDALG